MFYRLDDKEAAVSKFARILWLPFETERYNASKVPQGSELSSLLTRLNLNLEQNRSSMHILVVMLEF